MDSGNFASDPPPRYNEINVLDRYSPEVFEAKWRDAWKEADLFRTREEAGRPKFYGLDFFPYPSGAGLSVGHCRNYIPTDVLCRMKFMQGFNVLHPMGFDAFGLPAENEALKRKRHPWPMVQEYGATYKRQMDLVGVSYDWSRSFYSSDPSYYKWTQWIFKKLYEKGLAERKESAVNWDPIDKTVLANEEIIGGRAERSGALVEKKIIPQWYFRITEYAQRLIDDLDLVDWPEGIKNQQRNWIGRSEGVQFAMRLDLETTEHDGDFVVKHSPLTFEVFTTRIDTIFGMTFCVLAPEHPLVEEIMKRSDQRAAIQAYREACGQLSDMDRQAEGREKTGVFTGVHAINPANGARVPVYIADYVLMGYGTGAIMAVPAHDQRDFDFAVKFGLEVVPVFEPGADYLSAQNTDRETYLADPKQFREVFSTKGGTLVNSGEYSGQDYETGTKNIADWIEAHGIGHRKVQYKLRDWLISRQRYWGCPIPVVHDAQGHEELVPDDLLPVYLPDVESYEPTDDGQSPLARIDAFVNVTTREGSLGRRETDTMGGFACSSWYFLRFCDPHNEDAAFDPARVGYWMPVDCYVGGAEHAVMHLLYARFWNKVLFDLGLVPHPEPFHRLQNQGQVLAMTPYRRPRADETLGVGEEGILISFEEAKTLPEEDVSYRWARMSKSKGNVVTPDEAVAQYGADALRVYELFVAPFEADVQWSNDGMQGAVRFLSRIFRLVADHRERYDKNWRSALFGAELDAVARDIRRWTHQTIAQVTSDIEAFRFNTSISALMIFVNNLNDVAKRFEVANPVHVAAMSEAIESLVLLIAPAAPHSADELWQSLGQEGFTYHAEWPVAEAELAKASEIEVAIQVNGKLRDTVRLAADADQAALEAAALASEKVQTHLEGKTVRKVIVVPGKLVNIVAN